MYKCFWSGAVTCLLLAFVLCFQTYALEGGKVIGAEKIYFSGGYSSSSSGGTNSSMLPIGVGYGFSNEFEGSAAYAFLNLAGLSASGFELGIKYQLLKSENSGINLAFDVPVAIYSVLGISVNQSGLLVDISKDFQGYSPFISAGVGVTSSGSNSITSYPVSLGIVFYPANNYDLYGSIGTSFHSNGGNNPTDLSVGVEIKI